MGRTDLCQRCVECLLGRGARAARRAHGGGEDIADCGVDFALHMWRHRERLPCGLGARECAIRYVNECARRFAGSRTKTAASRRECPIPDNAAVCGGEWDAVCAASLTERLRSFAANQPPRVHQLILRHVLDGVTAAEFARQRGISACAARQCLARAMRAARAELREWVEAPEDDIPSPSGSVAGGSSRRAPRELS